MTPSDIDAVRERGILSALAGAPFLLAFGLAWIVGGILSYVLPPGIAPWIYPILGMPAAAVAIALERRVGYVPAPASDPLLPLALQLLFLQIVAFPAILLVWDATPAYVPVAFAAIVGAHFLPFQWIYKTSLYGILGVLVALGPYVLAVIFREKALHYTGFFVGACLLVGSFAARAHARAAWRRAGAAAPPPP